MTGLSVDTLRAWERRYHAVKPVRTPRGRLYDDRDVARFLRLRNALGKGFAIGEVAALSEPELTELLNLPHEAVVPSPPADTGLQAILAAVESFDSARLNAELGRMAALLGPAEFVYEVAIPLMHTVGDRWHAGALQTAHEHLATDSIRNILGAMARLNHAREAGPKLLATTPSGELHELGVLAAAVLAGTRGFDVACLGPNLPTADILYAVERFSPRILVIGVTSPEPPAAVVATVQEVAALLPANVELWLGGAGALAALDDAQRSEFVFFDDLQALERTLEEWRREKLP